MTQPSPRLTVGLPVFNGERYLEASARSILNPTYANFELLIADNTSSDGTEEICRELSRIDDRVHYVRHRENIGAGPNTFVLEHAKGKLFRWAGDDDSVKPTAFERCIDLLDDAGSDAVLAFPQTEIIDERGEHVRYWAEQGAVDGTPPIHSCIAAPSSGSPPRRCHVVLLWDRPNRRPPLDSSPPALLRVRPGASRRTRVAGEARQRCLSPCMRDGSTRASREGGARARTLRFGQSVTPAPAAPRFRRRGSSLATSRPCSTPL